MDQVVAKATANVSKVFNSPFGRAAMPGADGAKPNDSIDFMRQDFMADYQKIMRESGETFFKPDHPALSA